MVRWIGPTLQWSEVPSAFRQEISNGRTHCFRTPKKPEYLRTRSQVFVRGPLGFGPIQFLMDFGGLFFWGGARVNQKKDTFFILCFFSAKVSNVFFGEDIYSKFWKTEPFIGVFQINQFLWCLVFLVGLEMG